MKALSARYEYVNTDMRTMRTNVNTNLESINVRMYTFNYRVNTVEANQTFIALNTDKPKNVQKDRPPPGRNDEGHHCARYTHDTRYDSDNEHDRRHRYDGVTKKCRREVNPFDNIFNPKTFSDWLMELEDYFDWFNMSEEHKIQFLE